MCTQPVTVKEEVDLQRRCRRLEAHREAQAKRFLNDSSGRRKSENTEWDDERSQRGYQRHAAIKSIQENVFPHLTEFRSTSSETASSEQKLKNRIDAILKIFLDFKW